MTARERDQPAAKPLRVAALGDLHVRETSAGAYRDLLDQICNVADVLLLCGDLTEHGLPHEAEILADDLRTCKLPMLAVLGNHDVEGDRQETLIATIEQAGVTILNGDACEVQGVGFAGVKGFAGGFGRCAVQPWGEPVMREFVHQTIEEAIRLESALAKLRTERTVVLLHFAPIRDTVEGEHPEIITYLGSSRLAEPIDRYGVRAVFHGHAHHGQLEGKTATGIPVYNVALPLLRHLRPEHPFAVVEI